MHCVIDAVVNLRKLCGSILIVLLRDEADSHLPLCVLADPVSRANSFRSNLILSSRSLQTFKSHQNTELNLYTSKSRYPSLNSVVSADMRLHHRASGSYLPCLVFHLPSAFIRTHSKVILFLSPYQALYGAHLLVGYCVSTCLATWTWLISPRACSILTVEPTAQWPIVFVIHTQVPLPDLMDQWT